MNVKGNIRRKADREALANCIKQTAADFGFEVTWEPERDREIVLDVATTRGLHAMVIIDGRSVQPDVHCIHWHVRSPFDSKLEPAYWGRERLNTVHYGKATDIADSFDELVNLFRMRFTAIANGRAFQQEVTA